LGESLLTSISEANTVKGLWPFTLSTVEWAKDALPPWQWIVI